MTDNRSQPPGAQAARKSGRLGAAGDRLAASLARLEAALEGAGRARAAEAQAAAQALAAAQAQTAVETRAHAEARAGDAALMARLREENAALHQIRDDVSGRLDAAIERLSRVLAH
jgi:hypothetical protein